MAGHYAKNCMRQAEAGIAGSEYRSSATPSMSQPRAPRAQREAALKARTQLASALVEEERVALDDALDTPTAAGSAAREVIPSFRMQYTPQTFERVC